jgi:hypothetical protein
MNTNKCEATRAAEHAAPPEAWDAIAEGYYRYVAPQKVDLANEALRLVALEPGERFLDVAAGTGVSVCRLHAWAHRCSQPTGRPR